MPETYIPPAGHHGRVSSDWWSVRKKDYASVHEKIGPLVEYLSREHSYREQSNHLYYSLYGGVTVRGLGGARYAMRQSTGDRLRLNVIHAMVSTVVSKIAKNKTRIIHLTEGGDFRARNRGKKLTKLTNGAFWQMGLYREMRAMFRNACVFDLGAIKFFTENGNVKCENVFPNEIRVDDVEAVHGKPRQIHQVKHLAREVVQAAFPEHAKKLERTARWTDETTKTRWTGDMIEVVESWHLPSGGDADDGMRTITVENCTLLVEPYKKDYFPFVFFRWDEMPLGFFGQGLTGQLVGIQYEINRLLQTIQEHLALGVGYIAVEASSGVDKNVLSINEIGRFIEFTDVPPQWVAPNPVPPQYIEQLIFLINQAYEVSGISQLAATGRKPAGLNSGTALREYQDIESERFAEVTQRFEEAYLQASKIVIDMFEDIADEQGDVSIRAADSNLIETIDFSQARMERDSYTTRVVPSGFLPTTPAGKLEFVQEMLQGGLIGADEGRMLLDYPDLESVNDLANAPLKNIDRRIELMLDTESPGGPLAEERPPQVPDPFINLPLAIKRATSAYQAAEIDGAPDENLDLLRQFIENCQYLLEEQSQPKTQANLAPGPQSGGPGAPPMPQAVAPGLM